jgi:hypothetical protein
MIAISYALDTTTRTEQLPAAAQGVLALILIADFGTSIYSRELPGI